MIEHFCFAPQLQF